MIIASNTEICLYYQQTKFGTLYKDISESVLSLLQFLQLFVVCVSGYIKNGLFCLRPVRPTLPCANGLYREGNTCHRCGQGSASSGYSRNEGRYSCGMYIPFHSTLIILNYISHIMLSESLTLESINFNITNGPYNDCKYRGVILTQVVCMCKGERYTTAHMWCTCT